MTLEDCISIAIQNSKIFRVVNGSNQQIWKCCGCSCLVLGLANCRVLRSAITAIQLLALNRLPIDNNGNRIPIRGAVRANQVGGVEDALSEFDAQFSRWLVTTRPIDLATSVLVTSSIHSSFKRFDSKRPSCIVEEDGHRWCCHIACYNSVYSVQQHSDFHRQRNPNNFGRSVPSDYTACR